MINVTPAKSPREVREAFANEFLRTLVDHDQFNTLDDLLDILGQELGEDKLRYGSALNADSAWCAAVDWLSDRGYTVHD